MSSEDYVKLGVRYRVDFASTCTSPLAELLFLRGMAYSGLNNTTGVIPAGDLPVVANGLRNPLALVGELVAGDYWTVVPNGWHIRSWDKWQGDFDQVAEKRRRDAERKRLERRAARDASMNGGGAA